MVALTFKIKLTTMTTSPNPKLSYSGHHLLKKVSVSIFRIKRTTMRTPKLMSKRRNLSQNNSDHRPWKKVQNH